MPKNITLKKLAHEVEVLREQLRKERALTRVIAYAYVRGASATFGNDGFDSTDDPLGVAACDALGISHSPFSVSAPKTAVAIIRYSLKYFAIPVDLDTLSQLENWSSDASLSH